MSTSHISKDPDPENKKLENIKAAGGNDSRIMRRVTERRRGEAQQSPFFHGGAKVVKVRLRRNAEGECCALWFNLEIWPSPFLRFPVSSDFVRVCCSLDCWGGGVLLLDGLLWQRICLQQTNQPWASLETRVKLDERAAYLIEWCS